MRSGSNWINKLFTSSSFFSSANEKVQIRLASGNFNGWLQLKKAEMENKISLAICVITVSRNGNKVKTLYSLNSSIMISPRLACRVINFLSHFIVSFRL